MANDPWTGARLGSNNDSPLGGSYLAEVVTELAPSTCPAFTNAAARDAALQAWVAAGHTSKSGMLAYTSNDDRFWRLDKSLIWRYLGGAAPSEVFPTFGGGWSNQPGFDALRCFKDGSGLIHVTGTVTNTASFGANTVLAVLPTGYRPTPGTVSRRVYVGNSQVPQRCDIDNGGGMTVMPSQGWTANNYWTVDLTFHPNTTTTAS